MRITRFDLTRYGLFQDQSLHFPVGESNLHLIVGPNEAGKSTFRKGILDWLFGIPARSDMAVGFEKSQLQVGGRLESTDGSVLDFARMKTQTASKSMVDAHQKVLPLSALDAYAPVALGREGFEYMFCMGAKELAKGASELLNLNSADRFASVLWQSASGIPGLTEIQTSLEEEINKLWSPRMRKGQRAVETANARFLEAKVRLRELSQTATAYEAARKAAEKAGDEVAQLRVLQSEAFAAAEKVARTTASASIFDEYRSMLLELQSLGGLPRLPADADARWRSSQVLINQFINDLSLRRADLTSAEAALAALPSDRVSPELVASVRALLARVAVIAAAAKDLPPIEASMKKLFEDATAYARAVGLPTEDVEKTAQELPSKALCETLISAIDEKAQLESTERVETSRVNEMKIRVDKARASEQAKTAVAEPDARVESALKALKKAMASPDRSLELQRSREQLAQLTHADFPNLDDAALKVMRLPDEESVEAALTELKELDSKIKLLTVEIERDQVQAAQIEAEQTVLRSQTNLDLSDERLARLRGERDAAVAGGMDARAGQPVDEVRAYVERLIAEADELADQRLAHAAEVERMRTLESSVSSLQSAILVRQGQRATAAIRQNELRQEWESKGQSLGIGKLTPTRVDVLRRSLQVIIKASNDVEALAVSVSARNESLAVAERELHALLPDLTNLTREDLVDRVELLIEDASAARTLLLGLSKVRIDAEAEWREAQSKLEAAQERLPAAEARVRALAAQAGLAPDIDLALAKRQVSGYGMFETSLAQYLGERLRVQQMSETLQAGLEETRTLAAACGVADGAAFEVQVEAMKGWVEEGRTLQEQRSSLESSIKQLRQQVRDAEEGRVSEETELSDLIELAGGVPLSELGDAIQKSARAEKLEVDAQRLRVELVKAMGGLEIAAIEAVFDSEDRSKWGARKAELDATANSLHEQGITAGSAWQAANAELKRFGDSDALLQEEAKRQSAIVDMREAAERYVSLRTQLLVLKWAFGKYREQAQGPMLTRASHYFSRLTLGRYKGLTFDMESDTPRLVPVLSNDRFVDQAHLSEGTLKPFYLALRLAAIEIYLEANPGMIFIADDIFVEMDDERAAAGFEILGELARKEQVIYLTHHQHLEPIARGVVPGVQVQQLVCPI